MRSRIILIATLICLTMQVFAEDFTGKNLKSRSFVNRGLNGADFTNANLDYADFTGASLKKAIFKNAAINYTNFNRNDLTGADFTGASGSVGLQNSGIRFAYCNLHEANLQGLTVEFRAGCDLTGANLRNAVILGVLLETDLRGADLRGANLRVRIGQGNPPTRFQGAKYDDNTVWPEGFDIESSGAIKTK